jgi:hypothetical protein
MGLFRLKLGMRWRTYKALEPGPYCPDTGLQDLGVSMPDTEELGVETIS